MAMTTPTAAAPRGPRWGTAGGDSAPSRLARAMAAALALTLAAVMVLALGFDGERATSWRIASELQTFSTAPGPACSESELKTHAMAVLSSHYDVDLGAVMPDKPDRVGFEYLKTADALLAAQAIAHDDFSRAADHVRHVLGHQRADGSVPLLVYGASVDRSARWIASNLTFYPGPAFWPALPASTDALAEAMTSTDASTSGSATNPRLVSASVLAPPIAADVVWQMFRLSPYETVLGVVGHSTNAVRFLCDTYEPLKRLQTFVFLSRSDNLNNSSSGLLKTRHPWETFSPLSAHWKSRLAPLMRVNGYDEFVAEIPEDAKQRFALGAKAMQQRTSISDPVKELYEPMMFLASCLSQNVTDTAVPSRCPFAVHDVEFNALVLRSAEAMVQITRLLMDRSSVCPKFTLEREDLHADIELWRSHVHRLHIAIDGSPAGGDTDDGLWNSITQSYNNDDADAGLSSSPPTLRNIVPACALQLSEEHKMGILSHFLPSGGSGTRFFCDQFPASYLQCSTADTDNDSTDNEGVVMLQYNYALQRAFRVNDFPGLADYMRNKTRNLVCASSQGGSRSNNEGAPTVMFASAYTSSTGTAMDYFDDGMVGSTLAAATLLNIMLPAVMPPPSPDTPPIDHRMLTVIMCIELVVAFAVALGCVFFSVYFVANRPREMKQPRASVESRSRRKRVTQRSSEHRSEAVSGYDDSSQYSSSDANSSYDLEEALLSEEEDSAYGSFSRDHDTGDSPAAWKAVKDVLASISPW